MGLRKILVIDDEELIRKPLNDFLRKEGYIVIEADNGKTAIEIISHEQDISLVILDTMLPDYDGWMVCREIRKISKVPIIMLADRREETDELHGFEIGADEYVTKPFNLNVLAARINAILRRTERERGSMKVFGGIIIDYDAHVVYVEGNSIELSPKEYELLCFLVENTGKTLSREQILNSVWGYEYIGSLRTIDTHINRLRIKLKRKGDYIQTVWGFGYKFEAKK